MRAGGTLVNGRMIARKDDPVWDQLGSSALFEDGLDNPYPPFAFNSGMGIREVPREECVALGVIEADEVPQIEDVELNEELQLNADQFDPAFLDAVIGELDATIEAGEIKLRNRATSPVDLVVNRLQSVLDALAGGIIKNTFDPNQPRDEDGQWVSLEDEAWTGTPKEMHQRADKIMRGFKSAKHPQLGEVHFTGKGRAKTLFDKRTPHEFQSVQAIPALVSSGKLVSSLPDRKGRSHIVAVHKLEHGLKIGPARYKAEITVRETREGVKTAQRFYLHRLFKNRKASSLSCLPGLSATAGSPAGNANEPRAGEESKP